RGGRRPRRDGSGVDAQPEAAAAPPPPAPPLEDATPHRTSSVRTLTFATSARQTTRPGPALTLDHKRPHRAVADERSRNVAQQEQISQQRPKRVANRDPHRSSVGGPRWTDGHPGECAAEHSACCPFPNRT